MSTPIALVLDRLESRGFRPVRSGSGWSARCPGHEDHRASLSVSEGDDGKVLLRDHAGCETADVLAPLGLEMKDLFPEKEKRKAKRKDDLGPIVATYDYVDEESRLLFQVTRHDPKDFRQRRPDPTAPGGWRWSLNGVRRVLFRLREVVAQARAGGVVFIPEGEKDVLALERIGLVATTNSQGAEAEWLPGYTEALRGAHVVVLPDPDEPGRKHGETVAKALHGVAASVRVLSLAGPGVKDAADFVAAGGTREELEALADAAPEWNPAPKGALLAAIPEGPDPVDDEDRFPAHESSRAPSCAAELIEIGRAAELFTDERGDGYAAFGREGVRRLLKIRSGSFSSELHRAFAERHDFQRAANGEAVAAARAVLEAIAQREGRSHALSTRFARHEGAIWIDMADPLWRAIRITPGRWEIVDTPPFLFRRYPHMRPLPEPVRGGNLAALLTPFRMAEAERILVLAYVATAVLGDIPRPLLLPHGPQGSGKSTLLKMILSTLDPSGVDDLDLGSDPRELAQVLDQHGVAFFDNVVRVSDWQARLLCKASTGGGIEKRRLFSDEDSVILTFKRAVMISSINVPTHAPDLLDRCLLVALERIGPDQRRREDQLWEAFREEVPGILGGLLDTLAAAMEVYPGINPPELPRMADFATWGAAVNEALDLPLTLTAAGTIPQPGEDADGRTLRGADAFLKAYTANVGRQTEEVIEADPVARAVLAFARDREGGTWTGSPSELFLALQGRFGDDMKTKDSGWPRRPDGLTRRLRVLHATLEEEGLAVTWRRTAQSREVTLAVKTPRDASSASSSSSAATGAVRTSDDTDDAIGAPPPERVTRGVIRNPAWTGRDDAYDADDASGDLFTAPATEVIA